MNLVRSSQLQLVYLSCFIEDVNINFDYYMATFKSSIFTKKKVLKLFLIIWGRLFQRYLVICDIFFCVIFDEILLSAFSDKTETCLKMEIYKWKFTNGNLQMEIYKRQRNNKTKVAEKSNYRRRSIIKINQHHLRVQQKISAATGANQLIVSHLDAPHHGAIIARIESDQFS